MKGLVVFIVLLGLVSHVKADDLVYTPKISLNMTDFFGECNAEKVRRNNLYEMCKCVGNFVSPVLPNPKMVFEPITQTRLNEKFDFLFSAFESDNVWSSLNPLNWVGFLLKLFNVFLVSIFELLFGVVKFLIVFFVKFGWVYLFWVSITYQTIILQGLLQQGNTMDRVQKAWLTAGIMFLGTVFALSTGGGWLKW